jgi:hypothetical protein
VGDSDDYNTEYENEDDDDHDYDPFSNPKKANITSKKKRREGRRKNVLHDSVSSFDDSNGQSSTSLNNSRNILNSTGCLSTNRITPSHNDELVNIIKNPK